MLSLFPDLQSVLSDKKGFYLLLLILRRVTRYGTITSHSYMPIRESKKFLAATEFRISGGTLIVDYNGLDFSVVVGPRLPGLI